MATRIVVDPITRIEGHLRIEADIQGGKIVDAYSSGTMVRLLERIVRGRDPRDADRRRRFVRTGRIDRAVADPTFEPPSC